MPQTTTMTQDTVYRPVKELISRRMLLAGSAGLVGAAAVAARPALAQGTPPPGMPAVQAPVRQDWLDKRHEEIIEPALPIIDPHHHLWDRPGYRYLFPELLADVGSGHNIRATCYEQAREMYRADGPEELKSLGETELNGTATP
jgi:L-fuconolactonase